MEGGGIVETQGAGGNYLQKEKSVSGTGGDCVGEGWAVSWGWVVRLAGGRGCGGGGAARSGM